MATIKLTLSSKIDPETNKSEIHFRFSGGRKFTKRIKTGVFIEIRRWNENESKIIIPRVKSAENDDVKLAAKKIDDLANLLISEFENQINIDSEIIDILIIF